MRKLINRFRRDEDGVVYVEYAILIGLIGLVVVVGATALGTNINTLFSDIAAFVSTISVP